MATSSIEDFPPPSVLKEAFQHVITFPVVFKNTVKSLNHVPWTSEYLSKHYGKIHLDFRVVPKTHNGISWEGAAQYVETSINQFLEWQAHNKSSQSSNPLHKYDPKEFWAYSGYNYLSQIFTGDNDILKMVDWSMFGYPETSLSDSAFWIGSEGAYTPCHFDTYGFNFVAQIYGRKKWILFPPEDTSFMYPTRIPYEESSVFSAVNILCPDFHVHPLFKFSHPYVVTLEPGEVLFVPHKWWHFVQSLETAVSINTWIQLDSQNGAHLQESVTRALMSSFISFFEPEGESWLNPNEEIVSPEETLAYISSELDKIKKAELEKRYEENDSSCCSMKKSVKVFPESDVHTEDCCLRHICHKDIIYVKPQSFSKWYGKNNEMHNTSFEQNKSVKRIMDCFVHPEVIAVMCKLLKEL